LDRIRGDPTASVVAPALEAGVSRRNLELRGNGGGVAADDQLREILQLLEKTSKML
jgi:hypothetical protein